MGTFDFLSGAPVAPQGYNPNAMQPYSPAWNTGSPQGMDYSQVLAGGQASPATQGLDFSKIGQWALNQPGSNSGGYAQALSALGNAAAPQGAQQTQGYAGPAARMTGHALGQVQQAAAGYIGSGNPTMPTNLPVGLLGQNRGY